MNTPKKIKRYDGSGPVNVDSLGGFVVPVSPKFAMWLGLVASEYVRLEHKMVTVFKVLMGIEDSDNANASFYSIRAPRARIDLMKDVLEKSRYNQKRPIEYDEILAEFGALTGLRNVYVHANWSMKSGTELGHLRDYSDPANAFNGKLVTPEELKALVERIQALGQKITTVVGPDQKALHERLVARLRQEGVLPPLKEDQGPQTGTAPPPPPPAA